LLQPAIEQNLDLFVGDFGMPAADCLALQSDTGRPQIHGRE